MKVLIVNGYPGNKGLVVSLSQKVFEKQIKLKNEVRQIDVFDLDFNLIMENGYSGNMILEKDLINAQKDFTWAEKIIFVFPIWWGGMPSLLRAFIERIFMPGFAFQYVNGKPKKLLKGKVAEIIATAGGPRWYYKTLGVIDQRRTLGKLLWFCGIRLGKIKLFGGVNPYMKKKEVENIFKKI